MNAGTGREYHPAALIEGLEALEFLILTVYLARRYGINVKAAEDMLRDESEHGNILRNAEADRERTFGRQVTISALSKKERAL